MRYTRTRKEETRRRILAEAKRMFCESGADAIGIGELMSQLGLTHGGFYAHFKSKDELVAHVCFEVFLEQAGTLASRAAQHSEDRRVACLVDTYLCEAHRDNPGKGCVMPALAAEVGRDSPEVRHTFTLGLRAYLERIASVLPEGPGDVAAQACDRGELLYLVSGLVGSMLLARAVNDPGLSSRILRETAARLKGSLERQGPDPRQKRRPRG